MEIPGGDFLDNLMLNVLLEKDKVMQNYLQTCAMIN